MGRVPDWRLDEVAPAGEEEHLDPDDVDTYAVKAGFDPTENVELLRRFGFDETSVVRG